MKSILGLAAFLFLTFSVQAQYGSYYGFSGGGSFSNFQDVGFAAEESKEPDIGLQFGAIYGFRFTDFMGIKTGLQYNAKGGTILYNGDSKLVLQGLNREIILNGTREMERKIKYHTLTVPFEATFKVLPQLQIGIGGYAGFSIASKMSGFYVITDAMTENQTPLRDPYRVNMSGSYYTDTRGPGIPDDKRNPYFDPEPTYEQFSIEGELITYLRDSNPYDEHVKGSARYLNRFDGGLYGSIEYSIRKGINLGVSTQYQLSAMTNGNAELNYKVLDDENEFTYTGLSKRIWTTNLYLSFTF